jgi:hypothetical protein
MNSATNKATRSPLVTAPPSLVCPVCDDGECVSADGSTHHACHACNGSTLVRCDACGQLGAVHEDDGTALCGSCLAEVVAAEASELAVRTAAAMLLPVLAHLAAQLVLAASLERMRHAAGLRPWRATPVDPMIAYCSMEDLGECDCPMCTGARPRQCTPPPPPAIAPPMPELARVDPDSSSWRAMRPTVRPGQGASL